MKKFFCVLLKIILFFIGWAIFAGMLPIPNVSNTALWRFFAELIPFLTILVFTIIFYFIEKKYIQIRLTKNLAKNFVLGSLVGIIWIAIPIIVLYSLGFIQKTTTNKQAFFWLWTISLFFNACMQELLVRGYIYELIKKNYTLAVSIILTTLIFTFLHAGAFEAGILAVLNVFSMSIFMSILLEYSGSLIAPTLTHFIWNFVGGLLTNGISLAEDYPSLIQLKFIGQSFLSGGQYKLEGSFVTLLINLSLSLFFFILIKKQKNYKGEA